MNRTKMQIPSEETAFYIFDTEILKKRIQYLKEHLPINTKILFALKANPFIVREIEDEVNGFEICSPGEAAICDTLEIPEYKMVISGVYKDPQFLEKRISDTACEAIYTVESYLQYGMLCKLADQYNKRIHIILRLTNDSQFGMDEALIEKILSNRHQHPNIDYAGIQYFSGTQKASVKKLKREIDHLDHFLCGLQDELGYSARRLEYGPGFPVSYFPTDAFSEEDYLKEFCMILGGMNFRTEIVLELGRSIAASCGRYYTHVVDLKQNKTQNYAIVDGGMHHLVYYGQSMAMKQPQVFVLGKESDTYDKAYTICGALCSMNDIIVKQVHLPDIEIGDLLCFENTGAYCMTEGISLFLSRDIPAIYLKKEDEGFLCVRSAYGTSILNTPYYERK